jgi:hypothetical protein
VENIIATSNAATVTIRSDGNVVMPDDVTYRFWVDPYVNPSHKPGYNETCQTMACEGAAWRNPAEASTPDP